MKKLIKLSAQIRLFLVELKIVSNGGLAKPETWRKKNALEGIITDNS